jgi:hypothetical protein
MAASTCHPIGSTTASACRYDQQTRINTGLLPIGQTGETRIPDGSPALELPPATRSWSPAPRQNMGLRTLIAATRSVPATEPTELPPPRYRCPDDCHVDAVVRRRTPGSCPACGKDCVELGPDRRQWARAAIAHLSVG